MNVPRAASRTMNDKPFGRVSPEESSFAAMLDRQAPGSVHFALAGTGEPIILAHRHAPAHEFINPGTPHLGVMVVPHYRLSQALFNLGTGWRDHFCPEPQPVHVLPPDTGYQWTVNGSSMTVTLAIPMAKVRDALDELDAPDGMRGVWSVMDRGFVEPMVYEMVMRLWTHVRAEGQCPTLLAQSHMTCVLHALATRGRGRLPAAMRAVGLSKTQLATAIDVIEARMDDDLSLDELAAACRLSRFHFSRLFRRSTGYAPYQYLVHRRIERARALLSSTKDGVAAIGAAVGFTDAGHFSRTFSRHTGLSPSRYRASRR